MKKLLAAALLGCVVMATTAFSGCAGLQTQHQKIAVACESAATAADTIASGVAAGRLTADQATKALSVYRTTVPFCQPEPVAKLSDVNYAALINAAGQLTTLAGESK